MKQVTEKIYQIETIDDLHELLKLISNTQGITLVSHCSNITEISKINFGLINLADTTSICINQNMLVSELNER